MQSRSTTYGLGPHRCQAAIGQGGITFYFPQQCKAGGGLSMTGTVQIQSKDLCRKPIVFFMEDAQARFDDNRIELRTTELFNFCQGGFQSKTWTIGAV